MLNTKKRKYPILIAGLVLLTSVGFFGVGRAGAQTFIQSYAAASNLQQGLIVRLDPTNSSKVESTTQTNIKQTLGIVVNSDDASVAFANQDSANSQQVFVATSGHYNVLVDDQNGPVNIGSYVTVSALNGIGMNDDSIQPIVVGQALSSFNGSTDVIGQTTVTNSAHQQQTIHIGIIKVAVAIAPNPLVIYNRTILPAALVKISQEVAGKIDSPWRIYLSVVLLGATIGMAIVMLYSGIKSSLISLGRNPLSRKSITRGLLQIIFTAIIIFITGIIGVYLLLRI